MIRKNFVRAASRLDVTSWIVSSRNFVSWFGNVAGSKGVHPDRNFCGAQGPKFRSSLHRRVVKGTGYCSKVGWNL